jgi:hypothetical protein
MSQVLACWTRNLMDPSSGKVIFAASRASGHRWRGLRGRCRGMKSPGSHNEAGSKPADAAGAARFTGLRGLSRGLRAPGRRRSTRVQQRKTWVKVSFVRGDGPFVYGKSLRNAKNRDISSSGLYGEVVDRSENVGRQRAHAKIACYVGPAHDPLRIEQHRCRERDIAPVMSANMA